MIKASAKLRAKSHSAKIAVNAASVGGTTIASISTNKTSHERKRLSCCSGLDAGLRPRRGPKKITVPEEMGLSLVWFDCVIQPGLGSKERSRSNST